MSALQRGAVLNAAASAASPSESKSGGGGAVNTMPHMAPLATPPRRVPALDTVFTIRTAREPFQVGHTTIAVPSRAMSNGSPSDRSNGGSPAATPSSLFNRTSLVAPAEPPPPVMRTMHAHHPRGMGKRRHTFSKNSKVLKEGMLMKMKVMDRLHQGEKAWHKRFFQIRDGFLLWFPAKGPRKKPSGWVRVRDVMAVRMCDISMGLPAVDEESVTRTFQVTTTARALYLRARTVEDMQDWMRMLVSSKCLTPAVNKTFAFPDIRSDDSPKESLLPRIESVATNVTAATDASHPETEAGDDASSAGGRHSRARRRSHHKHKHKHKHKHGSDRRHSRHSSGSRGSRSPAHRRHSHRHRSRGSKHSGSGVGSKTDEGSKADEASKAGEEASSVDKARRASGGSTASGRKSDDAEPSSMRGGDEASTTRRRGEGEGKSGSGEGKSADARASNGTNGKGGEGEGKASGDADGGAATPGGPKWTGAAAAAVARSGAGGAGGAGAGTDTPKSHRSIDDWEAHWDAENNRTVYVHKHTQETTTELPTFADLEAGKWIKCFDYDAGQQYYFHTKTGATQYEQPEEYTPDEDEVGQPGWGWGGWNKTLKSPTAVMASPASGDKPVPPVDAETLESGDVPAVAADGKPIVHWIECWDDNYHCPYFVNMESNISVWERPTGDHVRVTQYVEDDDEAAAVVEDEDVVVEDVATPVAASTRARAGVGSGAAGAQVATGVVRRGSVEDIVDEVVDEVDDHF